MLAPRRAEPVGICSVAILGSFFALTQNPPVISSAARKIIARQIAAIGGRDVILRHQSRRILGTFHASEQGLSGRFEQLAAAPNRLLIRMQIDDYGQVIRCFDGETGWQLEPNEVAPRRMEGAELADIREEAEYNPLYEDKQFQSIVDDGRLQFAGRLCDRLRIVGRSGKKWSELFDPETGLLAGRIQGDGGSAFTTIYDGYNAFDGLSLPTHIVKKVGDEVREELRITSVRLDSVPNNAFDMKRYAELPKLPAGFVPRKNGAAATDEVDQYVLEQMVQHCIPALSLAVIKNGQTVISEGYGWANLESATAATDATVYQLASITKVFTATAIMMLADEGMVNLDEKLSTYLTEAPEGWRQITIRHLLRHTSGLVQSVIWGTSGREMTDDEFLAAAARTRLRFTPGNDWSYSNIGYQLLGLVIHRVTGKPWHAFIRERIFKRAGMSNTRLQTLQAIVPLRAAGYRLGDERQLVNGFYDPQISAAGGILSTVSDLAKFDRVLREGKLLSRARLREMWDAAPLPNGSNPGYGIGWFVIDLPRGRKLTYHGGDSLSGFAGEMLRYIDDKLTVIVLTNRVGCKPMDIAAGIADIYLSRPK
jgi:CubicO group peptidase (beta-lactamase class C family)